MLRSKVPAILKDAGFIKDRREGKWIHYSIADPDMFRRFLVLSIFEKMDQETALQDRARLEGFLKTKRQRLIESDAVVAAFQKYR